MIDFKNFKKRYDDKGYVVVRNFLDKKKVSEIKLDLINFALKNAKKFKKGEINFTPSKEINSLHNLKDWRWGKKLQKNRILRKICTTLINEKIEDFGAELFSKPAKNGMPAPIHQDNFYWCVDGSNALTVWIALEDSGKKNGGIFYYDGTHKLGVLEHKPSFAPGSSQTIKYMDGMKFFKKTLPELKAGDCIIHHSCSVHGSGANKSNFSRTGLTIRYKSASSKIDLDKKNSYLKSLNKQLALR